MVTVLVVIDSNLSAVLLSIDGVLACERYENKQE